MLNDDQGQPVSHAAASFQLSFYVLFFLLLYWKTPPKKKTPGQVIIGRQKGAFKTNPKYALSTRNHELASSY